MEFEELKVEIPVDDGEEKEKDFPFNLERRYENKAGCFVTGFDVTSKEAQERKARRAKRFGLQTKNKHVKEPEDQSDQDTDIRLPSIDFKDLPPISEGAVRQDAILIHGVDDMSTKDVFSYFETFAPGSVEWIDDSSCNVVWDDDFTASRVMMAIGKEIHGHIPTDVEMSDSVEIRWRIGPPHPKAKCLLLRLATKRDKKRPGAAQRSLYYLINGNPNTNSHTGAKKGLVSASRKRKIQKERDRAKHMYADGPDVLFLDKIETEEEKMEIDEPPLKIMVTNDGPVERSEPSNLRMRMYADSVEEDESEEESDDDSREKRDKWKGRIERKQEKKEEIKSPKTLDLRDKLISRERHGFNNKNRPSLSIEIKEEPAS